MSNDVVVHDGGAASAGDSAGSAVMSREHEIRQIMWTDRSRYFRDGLDRELAEIRGNRAAADRPGSADDVPTSPLAPHRSKTMLQETAEGRELVSAWSSAPGGFDRNLEATQRTAAAIVKQMGDARHQRAFMARFDREVSERCRFHIYHEIRERPPANITPAGPNEIKRFSSTEPGADLLREWGNGAPDKVSKVWARVERFRRALDDTDDFESFLDWYNQLKPAEMKNILRVLAT